MRYFLSYQYVFISPKWLSNLALGTVCKLVPTLGGIVLMGYHFDMIEAMIRDGEENYPDFDVNRLLPYLKRGLWPFIIQVVAGIPLFVLMAIVVIVFFVAVLADPANASNWILFLFSVILVIALAYAVVVLPLVLPLELRAGLTESLRAGFSREFYVDFVKRCWKELFLSQLFIFGSGLPLVIFGSLLCCVGSAPAEAWVMFARSHLMYQIYMKYLERGGIPLVLTDEKTQI